MSTSKTRRLQEPVGTQLQRQGQRRTPSWSSMGKAISSQGNKLSKAASCWTAFPVHSSWHCNSPVPTLVGLWQEHSEPAQPSQCCEAQVQLLLDRYLPTVGLSCRLSFKIRFLFDVNEHYSIEKMGQCFFVPADVLTHNSLGKSGILFTWTETQGDGAELKVVSQCSQQAEFHNTPAEIFQLSWILQKPTLSAKESLK